MDKYFTPSIEDIRIGYECEILEQEWKHTVIQSGRHLDYASNTLYENKLRVSYLTKEQIEAEGWKHNGHLLLADITDDKKLGDENIYGFDKDGFHVVFHNEKRTITFIKETSESFHSTDVRYKGECKDINTFRYICKLLGIK